MIKESEREKERQRLETPQQTKKRKADEKKQREAALRLNHAPHHRLNSEVYRYTRPVTNRSNVKKNDLDFMKN